MSTSPQTVTLSDLADLVGTQTDPRDQPGALYVGLEHVGSGRFVRIGGGMAADVQSSKFAFRQGDVLYGKLRPYLDKAVLAEQDGVCTTELLVLRAKERIDPRFLVGVLHSRNFIEHAISGTTGAQHPRTSWHHISEFELPNFTREERSRIADLVWKAHDSLKASEEAIDGGVELKRAATRELFTRGLKSEPQKETEIGFVPESWLPVPVSSLGQVVTGTTPPTKDPSSYLGGEIPFIAPGDFEHGTRIIRAAKKITQRGLALSRALPKGTTCFVCIGSTIGKVGFIVDEVSSTNQQINSIVPFDDFDPRYVFYLMTFWSDYIRKQASPSPVPILSKGAFERIELFTSRDKTEQLEIVKILDALDCKIDLHKRKCAVLEDLLKTLLDRLMTGEIRVADLDLSTLGQGSLEGVGA